VPGLDGLRAVAVLTVMAFHAGISGAGGGLLGVDIFFVISGFLVTSLLLLERDSSGSIHLGRFWGRRARRLLPALLVLVAGMALYARWQGTGISPLQVKGDALSTLFYWANWHYVLSGQNYFVRFGAPSPLLHTWSLAVEEQFYLVWPIVVVVVLKRFGRGALAWTAGILALASAALCASLYMDGAPVDRLYYGTDTRGQALMAGALLAILLPLSRRTGDGTSGVEPLSKGRARILLAAGGVAGAASLAWLLHAVQGNGPFLYEGGFLLVAISAAAVVALVVHRPGHPLSRILAWTPLRYIGRISYGLYLYHWPLFLVLDEQRTGLRGAYLVEVRFCATFAAAALSFHLLESPIRTGRVRLLPVALRDRTGRLASLLSVRAAAVGAGAGVLTALVTVSVPSVPASAMANGGSGPALAGRAANPERALLIGDSMALTLGEGLGIDAARWGVTVANRGVLGCDLDPATSVNIMGTVSRASQGCAQWDAAWTRLVDQTNPDVVVVLLGRWETIDRLYGGRWTTVGQPAFDQHLQAELTRVVQIGASRGARVVLLTLPYIAQTTEQPDGSPWDMNLPSRTDAYNADVRAVVARNQAEAAVVDLNKLLDPGGRYVSFIDGVRVRDYDNEHLSVDGGLWLRSRLLPQIVALGSKHHTATPAGPASLGT
jgi:peptidoglycan/LPS O-acetylase OafA/YrhL